MASNLTAFDATKFSKIVIQNLDQINVARQLASREFEGDLTENSTVKVRTLGNVAMAPYAKLGGINYQDLSPALESFTVSDAQVFAFRVDDIDIRQNDINALDAYAKRAAVALNNTVESKILSQYTAANAANQITGAGGAALVLDTTNVYATIVKARAALSKQNVPTVDRYLVVDPDTISLLLEAPQFTRSTNAGDQVVANGVVGRIAGFDVYESNALPTSGGAKYLQFGEVGAISYAGQITLVEMIRLESTMATACRGLLLHDAHVFNENAKRIGYIEAAV